MGLFTGKTLMITGGTGSFGNAVLCIFRSQCRTVGIRSFGTGVHLKRNIQVQFFLVYHTSENNA